jgi:hypothetical protein
VSDWASAAACTGVDMTPWYPEQGQSGAEAKAVCAGCPCIRACAVDSVTRSKIHYASADGIRAGMGGALRRVMIRAVDDCKHEPQAECHDPGCVFCSTFRAHLAALHEGVRLRLDSNGDGATHGRKSTGARGCTCASCRFARSTIGQRLSVHVDVVLWFEWLLSPIAEHEGAAPSSTADFAALAEEHAEVLLAIAKAAATRMLVAA